jgi:DNA-binding NarL/FixJ family response regulator
VPPTPRQVECFETYARTGDIKTAAGELGISIQSMKKNLGQYYRRMGAKSAVQAAYLTWAPDGH